MVDELFVKLNELKPLKAEDQTRLDKKFRLEFNYNSNHLEGNTLTYGETKLLLFFGDTTGNHNIREYEETQAHDVAYRLIETWAKDTEHTLTEKDIKELNAIILVRPFWKDAQTPDGQHTRREIQIGQYKAYPNSVRLQNGEMFHYASPTDTPIKMSELLDWYRNAQTEMHPIELAAMLHYKFVCIHPFDDGNGRISRLLMNYVLLKNNYPPVIIKSADKANYLRALHFADIGEPEKFVQYISEQLLWALELSIKAAKGESLEEEDDFMKEIELIKRRVKIKDVPKSPTIVYDTFAEVDEKIWKSLLSVLAHFDELFSETRNFHYVNDINEDNIRSSIIPPIQIVKANGASDSNANNKIDEHKIFGHDIYRDPVNSISWRHKMFSLKGANPVSDSFVFLELVFSDLEFAVKLNVDGDLIYEKNKRYSHGFLIPEIREIEQMLKSKILECIHKTIN